MSETGGEMAAPVEKEGVKVDDESYPDLLKWK